MQENPIFNSYYSLFWACSLMSQKKWVTLVWVFICFFGGFAKEKKPVIIDYAGVAMWNRDNRPPAGEPRLDRGNRSFGPHPSLSNYVYINNLWIWLMIFLVVPFFIISFVHSLIPSTIFLLFQLLGELNVFQVPGTTSNTDTEWCIK